MNKHDQGSIKGENMFRFHRTVLLALLIGFAAVLTGSTGPTGAQELKPPVGPATNPPRIP